MVCHRMCDYHHYSLEEEERQTTMVTTTREKAQGKGCHYDTTTRMTAMVTTMQDRLQERSLDKRTTTSSDYVIRLTDRLRMLRSKLYGFFSQNRSSKNVWETPESLRHPRPPEKRGGGHHPRKGGGGPQAEGSS